MGEAARAYVERENDLGRVAGLYAAALEEAAGDAFVREGVLREVAAAAADTGVEPELLAPELRAAALVSPDGRAPAGHVPVPGTGTRLLRSWPMWIWLAGLYAVSVVVQLTLGLRVVSPWIMVDELVYSDMARSFAATGHFLIRGVHGNYGFVYPLLLSPAYAIFGSMHDVYEWARVLNALLMSSAVVPAYLVARRVVRPSAALAAAALAVAIPSLAYVGMLMTENAFYPLFLWLAFALVLMLEKPTLARQLAVLGLCVLAFVTRAQTVALVAGVLTAPLVLAWIERGRPRSLKAFAPLYGIVVGGAALVAIVEVALGRSPTHILGNYSKATGGGYHFWTSLKWLILHLAELDLYLWIVPFAAVIVLVANARHLDRRLRVFAAVTVSLSAWLVLEVAVFASRYSLRVEERNLFYVAPLFLVALLAWIERGQPRPPRAAVAAAGVAAALPGALPFAHLLNITAESDTLRLPAVVVRRRRVGKHRQRFRRCRRCLDRARRCVPLAAAPLGPRPADRRRARLRRDVDPARGVEARAAEPVEERARAGHRPPRQQLDRRRRRPRREGRGALVGREPAVGLAERVLEPQRRARLRPRHAAPGRHAVDSRLGRLAHRRSPRSPRQPDRRALRPHDELGAARRDRRRTRPGEAARPLPRRRPGARDDAGQRPLPGRVPSMVRPESDVDALVVYGRQPDRHGRERRAPVQEHDADGDRDGHDADTDVACAVDDVRSHIHLPAHAAERRLQGLARDLARAPPVDYPKLHLNDPRLLGLHFDTIHFSPTR